MYNYFNGVIVEINANKLIVDVGGIGYELNVSSNCAAKFVVGQNEKVFAYLSVREDDMSLYGFYSPQEKDMFLRLITISGIGAKAAISILSGLKPDELAFAISTGDIGMLSSIKGIGKKTAERVVLELKDKITSEIAEIGSVSNQAVPEDAALALMSLGLTRSEAEKAVGKIDVKGKTIEEIVMLALRRK